MAQARVGSSAAAGQLQEPPAALRRLLAGDERASAEARALVVELGSVEAEAEASYKRGAAHGYRLGAEHGYRLAEDAAAASKSAPAAGGAEEAKEDQGHDQGGGGAAAAYASSAVGLAFGLTEIF